MLVAWRPAPRRCNARDGDAHLAYQIVGDRRPDLLFVPPSPFPIHLLWDEPTVAGHLHRLASFSRLILTDLLGRRKLRRGADPLPSCDAVLDRRAGGGARCRREQVRVCLRLVGVGASCHAVDREPALVRYVDSFEHTVGTGAMVYLLAPSWAGDAAKRRCVCGERLSGGPGYFKALYDVFVRTDVRPALESSRRRRCCCTGVATATCVRGEHAQDLVKRIRHARLVELDGDDNMWLAGDADRVLDEVESFLTGQRSVTPSNRVLSTVLFTDIVGSTERAAQLGDEAWTTALAAHNRVVERHVAGARGALVKFTGDGALATFDGPARAINCACAIRDAVEDLGLGPAPPAHRGGGDGRRRRARHRGAHHGARGARRAGTSELARDHVPSTCWHAARTPNRPPRAALEPTSGATPSVASWRSWDGQPVASG